MFVPCKVRAPRSGCAVENEIQFTIRVEETNGERALRDRIGFGQREAQEVVYGFVDRDWGAVVWFGIGTERCDVVGFAFISQEARTASDVCVTGRFDGGNLRHVEEFRIDRDRNTSSAHIYYAWVASRRIIWCRRSCS